MFADKEVLVYGRSTPPCSFCDNLKKLLDNRETVYTYKDISDEDNYIEFCSFKLRTVPAVFIDGEYVGGFTEVKQMSEV